MSFTTFLTAAATGLQIFGQVRQAQQTQQLYNYNAAVNRQKADMIRQAGDLKRQQAERARRRFRSTQVAAYAKAGVTLEGSPIQVIADSATELEMDILIDDYNTRIGIINAQNEAELDIMRGSMAASSGYITAGTTLLSRIPNFLASKSIAATSTPQTYATPVYDFGYSNAGTYTV